MYVYLPGSLYDATGNYDATFYMAGAAVVLTGLISLVAYFIVRKSQVPAEDMVEEEEESDPRQSLIDSTSNGHIQSGYRSHYNSITEEREVL